MASEVNVAILALIVALLALLIALGQLLQQIFGTADGYRRCQESVIGPWSKKVYLKWRWSQFRFETMFKTPIFTLHPVLEEERFLSTPTARTLDFAGPVPKVKLITATDDSKLQTMTPTFARQTSLESSNYVGWLLLLQDLHHKQEELLSNGPYPYLWKGKFKPTSHHIHIDRDLKGPPRSNFAIRFKEQSWDFMPPEIVRPLATSTIGNIVVIAHRLNMTWSDLRPTEGILRADGDDCNISSTTVRGLGLVLQYSFNEKLSDLSKDNRNGSRLLIPTAEADQFSCGIIPVNSRFSSFGGVRIDKFPVYNGTESPNLIATMLDTMRVTSEAIDKILKSFEDISNPWGDRREHLSGFAVGFADAIPLLAPFMPLPRSFVVKIARPFPPLLRDIMAAREFRLVLFQRLTMYLDLLTDPDVRLKNILSWLKKLRSKYPREFYDSKGFGFSDNAQALWEQDLIEDARKIYNETTRYFLTFESPIFGGPYITVCEYTELVAAHLSMAPFCYADAVKAVKKGKGRKLDERFTKFGQDHVDISTCTPELLEVVHLYVDRVIGSVEDDRTSVLGAMRTIHQGQRALDAETIRIAWWMLMLRGLAWHLSTCFVGQKPVASHFYGSMMPVYIA